MIASGTGQGAVAAGHPLTAQAAAEVLESGGNAFDACLAAALVACVCEPIFASLGGGGMMMAVKEGRKPAVYDFFADTPRLKRREAPFDWISFPSVSGLPLCGGMASVATPGTVAGIFAIHQDLGRMPLEEIASQALSIARQGHPVRALQARALAMVAPLLTTAPPGHTFLTKCDTPAPINPGETAGNTPPPLVQVKVLSEGDHASHSDLARLLEALISEGPNLFYKGEVADRLIAECAGRGGHLQREDLAFYTVRTTAAHAGTYRGLHVFTPPQPSLSGVQIRHTLALLEGLIIPQRGWGSDHHWGLLADALALTHDHIDAAQTPDEGINETALMAAPQISQGRQVLQGPPIVRRGTTHISVVDHKNNIASMTLSNGEGSGRVIPGCGVLLNNFLGTLERGHDERPWWIGRQRMGSLLAPTLLRSRDGRLITLGAGGSSRIRSAILQTIVNLVDFGLPPDQAINRRRLHVMGSGREAMLGAEGSLPDELRQRWPRHHLTEDLDMFFGGVQLAERLPSGQMTAAADPRRDGCALCV